MITYQSKTGYIKDMQTGACYMSPLYCPDGADLSVYKDITKATYQKYLEEQEAKMKELLNGVN